MARTARALLMLCLLPGGAGANWECPPSTTQPDAVVAGYYVDSDCLRQRCDAQVGVVVYEEANDIPGLQRKDAAVDDTCGDLIAPDRLLAEVRS